jgi:hypothetical protein
MMRLARVVVRGRADEINQGPTRLDFISLEDNEAAPSFTQAVRSTILRVP